MAIKEFEQNDSYVAAQTLTADVNGPAINTSRMRILTMQAVWTAGSVPPVGNYTVQASNDGTTWDELGGTSYAAGGAAGSATWTIVDLGPKFYRLKYTRSADGTGATVTVKYNMRD